MSSVLTPLAEQDEDEIVRRKMSLAEFNALPDDPELNRFLLRGELWELPMTKRNRVHTRIEARMAFLLLNWRDRSARGKFEVFSGEVGCDFPEQDSGAGIDVAVFSAATVAAQDPKTAYFVGAPELAVEIISPSDTYEAIDEKAKVYLDAGAKLVWAVDPYAKVVVVHQRGSEPMTLRQSEEVSGEPHLPGLRFSVAEVFE